MLAIWWFVDQFAHRSLHVSIPMALMENVHYHDRSKREHNCNKTKVVYEFVEADEVAVYFML